MKKMFYFLTLGENFLLIKHNIKLMAQKCEKECNIFFFVFYLLLYRLQISEKIRCTKLLGYFRLKLLVVLISYTIQVNIWKMDILCPMPIIFHSFFIYLCILNPIYAAHLLSKLSKIVHKSEYIHRHICNRLMKSLKN